MSILATLTVVVCMTAFIMWTIKKRVNRRHSRSLRQSVVKITVNYAQLIAVIVASNTTVLRSPRVVVAALSDLLLGASIDVSFQPLQCITGTKANSYVPQHVSGRQNRS